MAEVDGRSRVVIERVRPEVDGGRYPIKRIVGETVSVEADVFCDGHDQLSVQLLHRCKSEDNWQSTPMSAVINDRWVGEFTVEAIGEFVYTVQAWNDHFLSWHADLQKRFAADQVTAIDLASGAELTEAAAARADGEDRIRLSEWAQRLNNPDALHRLEQICLDADLVALVAKYPNRDTATTYHLELRVTVDRPRAQFSSWYEMFPRSAATKADTHGTIRDVEQRLPYVAEMGFDVLYLPPIHPVGETFRKGKNNATEACPGDVGSPWGIGSTEGGHKSVHPLLGTLDDFRRLVRAAEKWGIELALDIAFQCSPDHPYVREHPDWFRHRPDGSIQYAENPPKKYQDIYPFDFECADWRGLWEELKSVFDFWIKEDVKIFRVDNPHTKPFSFWEWCLGEIKKEHPDVLFLAEAFTRPKIMHRLAKLGFSQSYTYFAWRNTKEELTDYLTELAQPAIKDVFRPNLWPNTPDILTEHLQVGGRSAFMSRLVLAATLGANYGIYGPPYEHTWTEPREPGSEEYLNSEKYQIHHHEISRPDSLRHMIGRMNAIRREFEVLQSNGSLEFHDVDNPELICFSKSSEDFSEVVLVIVNLDSTYTQSGWVTIPSQKWKLDDSQPYQVHDLLNRSRFLWHGDRNYVELNPHTGPAHVFQVRRDGRTERDFEYFL